MKCASESTDDEADDDEPYPCMASSSPFARMSNRTASRSAPRRRACRRDGAPAASPRGAPLELLRIAAHRVGIEPELPQLLARLRDPEPAFGKRHRTRPEDRAVLDEPPVRGDERDRDAERERTRRRTRCRGRPRGRRRRRRSNRSARSRSSATIGIGSGPGIAKRASPPVMNPLTTIANDEPAGSCGGLRAARSGRGGSP